MRPIINLLLFSVVMTGCSRLPSRLKAEPSSIAGHCNIIIGENAQFDPGKSYQVVIEPTSELQREYAISAVQRYIQDHPDDERVCLDTYREALRQLQSTVIYRPKEEDRL